MRQGIMFNGETPMMEGKWYNPHTGDSFTVRNTFFEDNQLVVQTMDGRMLEYNQLQHYIQSNGNDPAPMPQATPQTSNQLPPEISSLIEGDGMLDDETQLIFGKPTYSQGPDWQEPVRVMDTESKPVENTNIIIISKALSKLDLPKLNIELDETTIPENAIKMLHSIMDIPVEEIVEWYINNMDIGEIRKQISDQLNTHISEILS
jgi:hypothetical protein